MAGRRGLFRRTELPACFADGRRSPTLGQTPAPSAAPELAPSAAPEPVFSTQHNKMKEFSETENGKLLCSQKEP